MITYIIASFISVCYLVFFLFLIFGWKKLKKIKLKKRTSKSVAISLVIPFQGNINRAEEIARQIELDDGMQIIFVNDSNEKNDFKYAGSDRIKIISNPYGKGKKNAIVAGIKQATGEWIVQSDADCFYRKDWLKSIKKAIASTDATFIILPVLPKAGKNFLQRCFSLEFFSMMSSGLAFAALEKPFIANGAAMAYKKTVYEAMLKDEKEKRKYFKHPSGDDVFLLHFAKKRRLKIVSFANKSLSVETEMPESLGAFINQRIRWASKSRFYKEPVSIWVSLLIFVYNLSVLASVIVSFLLSHFWIVLAALWGFKIILDLIFLIYSLNAFSMRLKANEFITVTVIYPIYIIFASLNAFFVKPFWRSK